MNRHATFAIAATALFVSLGGASEAARLIGASDIKKNAVRSKHVKSNSLTGADIKESTLKLSGLEGATGPPGPPGPQGASGAPAADLFAVVDNAHTGVVRGRGVTSFDEGSPDNGRVDILFDRNIEPCAAIAAVGSAGAPHPGAPNGRAWIEELIQNKLRIVTVDINGATAERPFHVIVLC